MVEKFTAHCQSMEVHVKLEHLKLCKMVNDESFVNYFKRFRTMSSQVKEMSDMNHVLSAEGDVGHEGDN